MDDIYIPKQSNYQREMLVKNVLTMEINKHFVIENRKLKSLLIYSVQVQ